MRTVTLEIERKRISRAWHTWLTGKGKWETYTEKRTFDGTYRGLEEAVLHVCMYNVTKITRQGDFEDIMSVEGDWDKWQLVLAWHRLQTKVEIDRAIKALDYQQLELQGV